MYHVLSNAFRQWPFAVPVNVYQWSDGAERIPARHPGALARYFSAPLTRGRGATKPGDSLGRTATRECSHYVIFAEAFPSYSDVDRFKNTVVSLVGHSYVTVLVLNHWQSGVAMHRYAYDVISSNVRYQVILVGPQTGAQQLLARVADVERELVKCLTVGM